MWKTVQESHADDRIRELSNFMVQKKFGLGAGFGGNRMASVAASNLLSGAAASDESVERTNEYSASSGMKKHWHYSSLLPQATDVLRLRTERAPNVHHSLASAIREVDESARLPGEIYQAHVERRFEIALKSRLGFKERLVWFWSNHFAVSVMRGGLSWVLAGPLEEEAIRPNISKKFSEMLIAVTKHPGMLYYLDGHISVGPKTSYGSENVQGLNENLAREILELHTLGINGGYIQKDVVELAKIITGWRFRHESSPFAGEFVFTNATHEPGRKFLLNKTYHENGLDEGIEALTTLAAHQSTARHLSRKIAAHFLEDNPSELVVNRISERYLSTEGDLDEIAQELLDIYAGGKWQLKLRLPQEFLVAMLRATGVWLDGPMIDRLCTALGQKVWGPRGPDGFPDDVASWLSPEQVKRRLDVAMIVAGRVDTTLEPMEVLEVTMGEGASDDTRWAVSRAESRQQAFALLFMSPEFQWR